VTRLAPLTALAAAGALALAGCGDSGPPRLSKPEYQRRASAICTGYFARIKTLGTPDKFEAIAPYIAKAIPILSQTVDQLGRIRPPKDQSDAYGRFLAAIRATRERDVQLRNAAARADGRAVQSLLADAARAGPAADRLARAADLPACVQS
jgi:hypothetical protein